MGWLPSIGSVVAGAFIASVIELLKASGIVNTASAAKWANAVLSLGWCAFVITQGIWPEFSPEIVAVIEFVAALLAANGFYELAVKAVTKKRYNRW